MKIHTLGLAVIATLALGTLASSAFAASGEWLVEGSKVEVALNAETEGLLTLVRLISATNSGILNEIHCEGIVDGTIGPGVQGTVTALLNPAKELITELGESPELRLNCEVTVSNKSITDCKVKTLFEVAPDNLYNGNGPWLTELLELQEPETGKVLVTEDLFGKGTLESEPGYEVRCETESGLFGEELCIGPTASDLTNSITGLESVVGEFSLTVSPEIECISITLGGEEAAVGGWIGVGNIWAIGLELEHLDTAVN